MRFIIYGVGAIGGTIAAALTLAGREVAGIARGKMLDAIQANGLLFRTPGGEHRVQFPCHAGPEEIAFQPDDVVILTMKGQDTHEALLALRAAGVTTQAVVCGQNGVANERDALRLFPNVYGMTVMLPGDYTQPGEVNCFGGPKYGMFDLGRYPAGADATAEAIAEHLQAANFAVFVQDEVMRSKHGKLLENLGNVLDAALGRASDFQDIADRARDEGRAVYRAAGIAWTEIDRNEPRRKGLFELRDVPGASRTGSSSAQSLKRGSGSIETDYLNGEIVLLGRLHGVPTPVNAGLVALGQRLIANRLAPGAVSRDEVAALLGPG
ncbi:MAG TPA: 2-dehydropantoate 2-reductase N-terminal domain-containing protein [Devosia sp.]